MVTKSMRRVFLFLTFLAFLSFFGSLAYYTSIVTEGTLAIATLLAIISSLLFVRRFPLPAIAHDSVPQSSFSKNFTVRPQGLALFFLGSFSLGAFLFFALQSPILSATRSLWLLFSPAHILLLAVAFIATLLCLHFSSRLSALLGGLLAALSASLAALLFPLGFGFDPFLHRATITHIAEFGTITPKPLYYIGAYALELWGHLLLRIPLFPLDTLLAPFALGVLTWLALRTRALHPVALAFLPFGAFISTTPQALGFLWIFLLVLTARIALPLPYLFLFAACALLTHPIAGVPALLFVLFSALHKSGTSLKAPLLALLSFFGIFAIPFLFLVQHVLLGTSVGFSLASLTNFARIPTLGFFNFQGNALLDTVMFFGGNLFLLVCMLAGTFSSFLFAKHRFLPILSFPSFSPHLLPLEIFSF